MTRSQISRWILPGCATVLGAAGATALANGSRVASHDAFASARGEAFAATADNPSAIYYNPAGIAQLEGHQLRAGVYGLYLRPTFDSPSGSSHASDRNYQAVPHFYYTYGPKEFPLNFGLGVYSPFGLSSRWPDDTGFRTVGTEAQMRYFTVSPVVAWKVRPNFSVAAGVTVNACDLDLQRGLVWPMQPYDNFRFQGDAWDVGYTLGVLWKPSEQLSFGVNFRSPTTMDLEGETTFRNDVEIPGMFPAFPTQYREASTEFPFPLSFVVGVSYRPTPRWNFEFNAELNDWDRLGTETVHQSAPFPPILPQDISLPLEWESSWYYEFGVTRYLGQNWSVSAGYIFNESSVPDAYYTPLVADVDRHFISVGGGYQGKHVRVDLAYQFGYGPGHTVRGSAPSAVGQTADGHYEFLSHAVLLTGQWSF
ncbi:MAG: outer membrane protein transport protein [Verrucomicrobiales bacterium]|nr:outer membrane protein transport protein [Verrucomicrobiales bacterium]